MSSESRNRLRDFARAALGIDDKGDGTCEICGRTGVRIVRKSTINRNTHEVIGRVWMCSPCLKEAWVLDMKAGAVGERLEDLPE